MICKFLQAGIASPEYPDQLLIALEPEAASIYVRKLRMHQLVPEFAVRRPLSPPRRCITPEPGMSLDKVADEIRPGRDVLMCAWILTFIIIKFCMIFAIFQCVRSSYIQNRFMISFCNDIDKVELDFLVFV